MSEPSPFVFGPEFFLEQLETLLNSQSDPKKDPPSVLFHLISGDVIEVAHILGVNERWIAVAAYDDRDEGGDDWHTEVLAYGTLVRISVRSLDEERRALGFQFESEAPMLFEAKAKKPKRGSS